MTFQQKRDQKFLDDSFNKLTEGRRVITCSPWLFSNDARFYVTAHLSYFNVTIRTESDPAWYPGI